MHLDELDAHDMSLAVELLQQRPKNLGKITLLLESYVLLIFYPGMFIVVELKDLARLPCGNAACRNHLWDRAGVRNRYMTNR